jgi:ribose transport system permease protein
MTQTQVVEVPSSAVSRRPRLSIPAQLGPVIGLLVVCAFFGAMRFNSFATMDNVRIMLMQTAVVAMAALGMTMIIIAGGIDLSVGSNIALACVTLALLLKSHVPAIPAAVGAIAVGAIAGWIIGLLITYLRLAPFIVTLGMWGSLRGMAKWIADEQTVLAPTTWLNNLMRIPTVENRWMIVPPGVWITLALAIFVAAVLRYTRFGRHVFAIGSNEQTARLCGVGVDRTKVLVYVLGGVFAGLAGVLQFSYLTVGDPTTATGLELDIIAAVVIGGASLNGGQGSIAASLIGAMIMTVVANGCTKVGLSNSVQEIVTGGIIIFAVALDGLRRRRGDHA